MLFFIIICNAVLVFLSDLKITVEDQNVGKVAIMKRLVIELIRKKKLKSKGTKLNRFIINGYVNSFVGVHIVFPLK